MTLLENQLTCSGWSGAMRSLKYGSYNGYKQQYAYLSEQSLMILTNVRRWCMIMTSIVLENPTCSCWSHAWRSLNIIIRLNNDGLLYQHHLLVLVGVALGDPTTSNYILWYTNYGCYHCYSTLSARHWRVNTEARVVYHAQVKIFAFA